MKREFKSELESSLGQALLYAAVLLGYFAAVLHFLSAWLYHLFAVDRKLYALATVVLLAAQGLLLEELTRLLSRWIRRKRPPASSVGRA